MATHIHCCAPGRRCFSDIIKHTAQFTAACGSDFLKGLAAREHRNPQFDFLKHTHAYFGYFTALVESYAKILKKDKTVFARLKADALSRDHILRRCVHRMNFQRKEEERRKAEEEEEDADRVAFQSIDWHDFVVVETIDFPDTEELPVAEESGPPEPTAVSSPLLFARLHSAHIANRVTGRVRVCACMIVVNTGHHGRG